METVGTVDTSGMGSTNGAMRTSMNGSAGGGESGAGDYAFGLLYSYPHRFWTVNDEARKVPVEQGDAVQLMASVWEPKTRTVLPDTGFSIEITRNNDLVSREAIYPTSSQPMGFHYGANFPLEGEGTQHPTNPCTSNPTTDQ